MKKQPYAEEARAHLRDLGFTAHWTATEEGPGGIRTLTYFTNGAGKYLLLLECLMGIRVERASWDLFAPLTDSSKVDETLAALEKFAA